MGGPPKPKLVVAAGIAVIAAALSVVAVCVYAILLLHGAAGGLRQVGGRLDKLDSMADDFHRLTARMSALEETSVRLRRVEGYMRYVPKLANTSDAALAQTVDMDRKLDSMNNTLIGTGAVLGAAANKLTVADPGMKTMRDELAGMHACMTTLTGHLPQFDDMRRMLTKADSSLDMAAAGIGQVNGDLSRVDGGLNNMEGLLRGMSTDLEALPEMKRSLDDTNLAVRTSMASLQQSVPLLGASLAQMSQTTAQMNQTTQDMARSFKKMPKQNALGIAIITAASLVK